jgi:hypothetical protein
MEATGTPFTAVRLAGDHAAVWRPTSPAEVCDFPLSLVEQAASRSTDRADAVAPARTERKWRIKDLLMPEQWARCGPRPFDYRCAEREKRAVSESRKLQAVSGRYGL